MVWLISQYKVVLHLNPGLMMFACTGTMAIRAPTQDLHGVLGVPFSLTLLQSSSPVATASHRVNNRPLSLMGSHPPWPARCSRASAAGPVQTRPASSPSLVQRQGF